MQASTQFWDQLAIESYKAILKKKPECALVHKHLGIVFMRIGRLNKAIRSFQRAAKYKNDDPEVYYLLSSSYQQCEKNEEAIRCAKKYLNLSKAQKNRPLGIDHLLSKIAEHDPELIKRRIDFDIFENN